MRGGHVDERYPQSMHRTVLCPSFYVIATVLWTVRTIGYILAEAAEVLYTVQLQFDCTMVHRTVLYKYANTTKCTVLCTVQYVPYMSSTRKYCNPDLERTWLDHFEC